MCHFVSFARLRRASDSHHAGTGVLRCHAVWRCPPSPAGGYAKQVHQWVTHVARLPLFSIHTGLSAKNVFVRNTWRELYKQMLHNIRNERTTGNIGNYRIRGDSFWFMVPFRPFKRTFRCSTHHSWQPQIILEDILVLSKVYTKMHFISQKWSVFESLVNRVCCACEWPLDSWEQGKKRTCGNRWWFLPCSGLL